jgi:hypothetical protein
MCASFCTIGNMFLCDCRELVWLAVMRLVVVGHKGIRIQRNLRVLIFQS